MSGAGALASMMKRETSNMASADRHQIAVSTVTTQYVLRLSQAEAEALLSVFIHVAGSLTDSPRKHVASILNALRDAGEPGDYWQRESAKLASGTVRFADYPKDA